MVTNQCCCSHQFTLLSMYKTKVSKVAHSRDADRWNVRKKKSNEIMFID